MASLNHPNIAAIHGFEQAEGKRFLVLEIVEGPTLAAAVGRGRRSIDLDIGYISLEDEEDRLPVVLSDSQARVGGPVISPDGRLLAYFGYESGNGEIYLTRFPSGEGRWLVSKGGGTRPFWGKDATNMTLFYANPGPGSLNQVRVTFPADATKPEYTVPETVINYWDLGIPNISLLDATEDGKRFIATQFADFEQQAQGTFEQQKLFFVENWFQEFQGSDVEVDQ